METAFTITMSIMAAGLWLMLALPGAPKSEAILPNADMHLPGEGAVSLNEIVHVPEIRPILVEPAVAPPIKLRKQVEIPVITPGQNRTWLAVTALQHSAAAFDAWSTRVSITSGRGKELNPLMRPFAGSGAIYGAIQVAPLATDFWGRRLMQSKNSTFRKLWWLPQAAATAGFMFSGANNLRVANGR